MIISSESDNPVEQRLKKKQSKFGFAAMERRIKKRRPPVGVEENNGSENDLGSFGRSYTPGVSSFYKGSRRY